MYKKENFNVTPEWVLQAMGKIRFIKSDNYFILGDKNDHENFIIEKALRALHISYIVDYYGDSSRYLSICFRVTREEFKKSLPSMYDRIYLFCNE